MDEKVRKCIQQIHATKEKSQSERENHWGGWRVVLGEVGLPVNVTVKLRSRFPQIQIRRVHFWLFILCVTIKTVIWITLIIKDQIWNHLGSIILFSPNFKGMLHLVQGRYVGKARHSKARPAVWEMFCLDFSKIIPEFPLNLLGHTRNLGLSLENLCRRLTLDNFSLKVYSQMVSAGGKLNFIPTKG